MHDALVAGGWFDSAEDAAGAGVLRAVRALVDELRAEAVPGVELVVVLAAGTEGVGGRRLTALHA